MAFDWISGMFQSEQTRGLSGDSASAVALDDSNPYYNYRLRRHRTEADLVGDPGLLWYTSPYVKDRAGLGVHVAADQGSGVASFTDVLIILSEADFARAKGDWVARATQVLGQEFEAFSRRENFQRLFADRPLGFRVVRDGSPEVGGQVLGLAAGEFVTGLLPNLYTGPVRGSRAIIGVHVNLPGHWDGYQEVGRLYSDQVLFTLGSHWLDNFSHPSLKESALYRLQQYPDGTFVHIINPDLQDRYQVTSTDQGGASVLTVATREGEPLAYVVLALIDEQPAPAPAPAARPAAKPAGKPAGKPGIQLSALDAPDMAPPMLIDDAVQPVAPRRPMGGAVGSKTIIPDAPSERILTFQERGALLQKVHFSAFMDGYRVYVGQRGDVGTVMVNPAATFIVRKTGVSLTPHVPAMTAGGQPLANGAEHPLETDTVIEWAGQRIDYRDLRKVEVDGWPYVGEIRRPASSTYMVWGQQYKVGRSRDCKVVLPDEPRNDNIIWKPKVGDGATIRARTGEIPKSRFYTDSIMVASEHAEVAVDGGEPKLLCTARHCYTYVRRRGQVVTLYPANADTGVKEIPLLPNDEVLVGNSVFHVGYSVGEAVAPAPAPRVELSPDSLLGAVSDPDFGRAPPPDDNPDFEETMTHLAPIPREVADISVQPVDRLAGAPKRSALADAHSVLADDEPLPPPSPAAADRLARARQRPRAEETPNAHGLGESGLAPEPLPLRPVGMDSIMGAALGLEGDLPSKKPMSLAALREEEEATTPGTKLPVPAAKLGVDTVDPDADVGGWDGEDWDPDAGLDAFGAGPLGAAPPPLDVPPPPLDVPPPLELGASAGPSFDEDQATSTEVRLTDLVKAVDTFGDDPVDGGFADDELGPRAEPTAEIPDFGAADDATVDAGFPIGAPPLPDAPPPLPVAQASAPPLSMDAPPPLPMDAPPPLPVEAQVTAPPPLPVEPLVAALPPTQAAPLPEVAPGEPAHGAVLANGVVVTDDDAAQFELGRPMRVVLVGWMVKGDATCGNHVGADLVIPENRIVPDQAFEKRDYFKLAVRGRRGTLEVLAPTELLVDEDDPHEAVYEELEKRILDVIRRDDRGDEDFAVRLVVREDRALPDPRARLVAIDVDDPLAAALVTRGLPKAQPRRIALDPVTVTFTWQDDGIWLTDYLSSYRTADGFQPFFVQQGDARFRTAPEDGSPVLLAPGDRLVVGAGVYVVREA